MKKIYINLFIPTIDKNYDIELPINLEMKYVIEKIQNTINELTEGAYIVRNDIKLYDKNTGYLINMDNIVKYSGLKNGCSVMIV